jgi:signal transduction histidine kinase
MTRILVIEDNDSLREEIVDVLGLEGYEAIGAPNGRLGLASVKANRPDLVICDLMMPVLDGYGTLKLFREDSDTATVPFLILTGQAERQHMRDGMELGADDYITKPFTIPELLRAVRAALAKQAKRAEETERKLEKLRAEIATALPHELRTPLACIMGYAEMLADGVETLPSEDVAVAARQILGAGQRLTRMSENALLFVQLDLLRQGRGEIRPEAAGVPTALDRVADEQARAAAHAHGREADLRLDLADAPVAVSPTYAARVVEELVDNACKFSPVGSVVHVSTAVQDGEVRLCVTDAGCGMSAEQIAAVGGFVQFERGAREQQGIGLGLSIAQRVTALWGGTLSIERASGGGTRVTVSLPRWRGAARGKRARGGKARGGRSTSPRATSR